MIHITELETDVSWWGYKSLSAVHVGASYCHGLIGSLATHTYKLLLGTQFKTTQFKTSSVIFKEN